jgi:hypothetical protein
MAQLQQHYRYRAGRVHGGADTPGLTFLGTQMIRTSLQRIPIATIARFAAQQIAARG